MNSLEQLASLLSDAIVNLDPQEFDAIGDAVRPVQGRGSGVLFGADEWRM